MRERRERERESREWPMNVNLVIELLTFQNTLQPQSQSQSQPLTWVQKSERRGTRFALLSPRASEHQPGRRAEDSRLHHISS